MTRRSTSRILAAGFLLLLLAPSLASAQGVPVNLRWTAPTEGAPVDHYDVYAVLGDGEPIFLDSEFETSFTLNAEFGVRYKIGVRGVSPYGLVGPMSELSDEIYFALPGQGDEVPTIPALRPNFPNPFNPETTIAYGVPESDEGSIRAALYIYNMRGERIRSLPVDTYPGWHTVNWDGRDTAGMIQPSGGYIVQFICNGRSESWKMTMLK